MAKKITKVHLAKFIYANEYLCRAGQFLVATKRLYKSVCPSIRPSVPRSVKPSLFDLLGATHAVYTALFFESQ